MTIEKREKFFAASRSGTLSSTLTEQHISEVLGFEPVRSPGTDGKVSMEWQWRDAGLNYAIWDYKGARWSFSGEESYFQMLFGVDTAKGDLHG